MSLFVRKQHHPADARAAEKARAEEAAGSREAPRPPRSAGGRDVLYGLASQGAGIHQRGPGADSRPRNTRTLHQSSGERDGARSGQGRDAVRTHTDRETEPSSGNTRIRPPQADAAAAGNTYIRPPQAGPAAPGAGAPSAPAGERQAPDAQPERESEFSFTPERPPLLRRVAERLRGACLLAAGIGVFLLTLAGVFKGSMWLYDWIHTSDTFVTRHIDITGNVRLSRPFILSLAGLHEGDNAFSVSVADMERRLRATPWVEDVSVQRILPDRFVIRVQERMPSFWVRRGERLYYANERGDPIAPVETDNFLSLPLLTVEPGCEDALPYLARIWKDLRAGALPVEPGAVATVDVSPSHGLNLFFEDREMRLSLSPDDWEGNLARLAVTFGDLARRRELARVQEVRAADGRVWVVLRGAAQ